MWSNWKVVKFVTTETWGGNAAELVVTGTWGCESSIVCLLELSVIMK